GSRAGKGGSGYEGIGANRTAGNGEGVNHLVVSPGVGGVDPVTGDGFVFREGGWPAGSPVEIDVRFGGTRSRKGELAGIEVEAVCGGKGGDSPFFSADRSSACSRSAGEDAGSAAPLEEVT